MPLFINGIPVPYTKFPGGEINIKLPEALINADEVRLVVSADLQNSDDVMALVMLTSAISQQFLFGAKLLIIEYFPYARQDRVCNKGEAHGVKAMAGIINSLGYDRVVVSDPHSDATVAALDNCSIVPQEEYIKKLWELTDLKINKLTFVSPDQGSEKKINTVVKACTSWGLAPPAVYARKTRNLATGVITGTSYEGDVTGQTCLIIDDICDGGRTFIELAKALKAGGAKKVLLYITHGIFSQGLDPLKPYIDAVYCWHCFGEQKDPYLTILQKELMK